MRSTISLLALGIVAWLAAPAAQELFRSGIETVFLSVSVSDTSRLPVRGLTREDFRVTEDGLLQDITVFASDAQPVALSMLIDSSISMERKMAIAQQAAIGFARRLGPKDVAQVMSFDTDVEIRQSFTSDVALLERAIRAIQPRGATSLYTALYVALSELRRVRSVDQSEIRRQVIVVLSDGEDTNSVLPFDEVLDATKRSNVAVYSIRMREGPPRARASSDRFESALQSLSLATGGRTYPVNDVNQLPAIYEQIAIELANQYIIGYTSKNPRRDGMWRRVSVQAARPNTTARTRSGYFAPRSMQ